MVIPAHCCTSLFVAPFCFGMQCCRESTNILGAIGAVNIFIEAGVEKGGVLVHCAGGRSRSAAFVVAFIMSTQGCGYDHAYAQVRRDGFQDFWPFSCGQTYYFEVFITVCRVRLFQYVICSLYLLLDYCCAVRSHPVAKNMSSLLLKLFKGYVPASDAIHVMDR